MTVLQLKKLLNQIKWLLKKVENILNLYFD